MSKITVELPEDLREFSSQLVEQNRKPPSQVSAPHRRSCEMVVVQSVVITWFFGAIDGTLSAGDASAWGAAAAGEGPFRFR